ncbi:eukaryotic peptide chain release factor subunit 1-like [Schistocerca gregaria]|uniref:eukaryotic peptide chain release factor subunit 1-like n=1 Tax=Schistocerca gregaria TaxID=7010 RepID=UPI00211DA73C|nr:eukaryotic peptide chain release factor subunit 1-like [Schistocerca gregaria]
MLKVAPTPEEDSEQAIQQWKIRRLIQSLESARGNGTSMISLIIPPGEQVSRYARLLAEEYGTASNIKSRVNRLSVLGAITSTQQKLKLYTKIPENGLVIYCGTVLTEDNKEKLVNLDIVPHKPINTSLYLCDNKFHTECLNDLMTSEEKYGFIVMDGGGALFGCLSGNARTVLAKFSVDLPKKHGRGGQSAVRFARLRLEKRHNYLRKVTEVAVQSFITNDKPNVAGLVLAGLAEFKNELVQSDMFDQRLQRIVLKVVDVSYGGENGFNQAIDLCQEVLRGVKYVYEKKILGIFFDQIAEDSGKYCFGIHQTMQALDAGAVETLIVYEDLDLWRHELRNSITKEKKTLYLTSAQEKDAVFTEMGAEWEPECEKVSVVEWFVHNYKDFGCKLQMLSNKSQEGTQFVKGFGGIGGILRYCLNFADLEEYSDDPDDYDFDF